MDNRDYTAAYMMLSKGIGGIEFSNAQDNRYLLAWCGYKLNKLREAKSCLLTGTQIKQRGGPKAATMAQMESIPGGARGCHLLGLICEKDNCMQHAVEYYKAALQLDPFLWESYEHLCLLGKGDEVQDPFKTSSSANPAEKQVLDLLTHIGAGLNHVTQFRSTQALHALSQLPSAQVDTGYVLHQKGKAHFEACKYKAAKRDFEEMRRVAPFRVKGLEVYSTNLWHLKEQVSLAYLAQ